MTTIELKHAAVPPVGLGLSSVILGATSLLLFFLPILGIPVGVCGMVIGLVGLAVAVRGGTAEVRLCVAGLMLSVIAIGMLWSIALAPSGYFAPAPVFPEMVPIENRSFVPPPAPPPSSSPGNRAFRAERVDKSLPL